LVTISANLRKSDNNQGTAVRQPAWLDPSVFWNWPIKPARWSANFTPS